MEQRRSGFTLKQLLVTLVIIAMLLALMFPAISVWRYRSLEARCRANLWAILVKYHLLKQQNGGKVDMEAFKRWLYYSPEAASFSRCPLGDVYRLAYEYDPARSYIGPPQYRSRATLDRDIILFCFCHTRPIKPGGCDTPVTFNFVKFLCACEGDKVEYRFLYPDQSLEVDKFVPPE